MTLEQFEEWLDGQRDRNVSEVFHDIVAKFAAAQVPEAARPGSAATASTTPDAAAPDLLAEAMQRCLISTSSS